MMFKRSPKNIFTKCHGKFISVCPNVIGLIKKRWNFLPYKLSAVNTNIFQQCCGLVCRFECHSQKEQHRFYALRGFVSHPAHLSETEDIQSCLTMFYFYVTLFMPLTVSPSISQYLSLTTSMSFFCSALK